jgi:serpin B
MNVKLPVVILIVAFLVSIVLVSGCSCNKKKSTSEMEKTLDSAFAASSGLSGRDAPPDTATAGMLSAAKSNNLFACDMYGRLKNGSGNLFFSPMSISAALAMTYAGAKGNTATQMEDALRFTLTGDDLHQAFGELDGFLQANTKNLFLSTANALWGQKGYTFLEPFLATTKGYYNAPFGELDFAAEPEESRRVINYWVEKKTRKRIKDLLPSRSITPTVLLVLVNTIYFNCKWDDPFKHEDTSEKPFYLSGGSTVQVEMMQKLGETFRYAETGDFKMVEIPYRENRYSMVIILPNKTDGLASLEDLLTVEMFEANIARLANETLTPLQIPKFTFETDSILLNEPLKKLGMIDAFNSGAADFSGMDGTRSLFITYVFHKAFVKVDEQGTEAAAATGVVMAGEFQEGKEFIADHPFLFLIRDVQTGAILFMGRITDPTQEQ